MAIFQFYALKTYKNNCSKSHHISFDYDEDDKRSMALLSVINDNEQLHDKYLIDHDTKCNITFDITVKFKGGLFAETGKGFNSDMSFYTFNELNDYIEKLNKRDDFISIVRQPFMRFHYSKSGKAFEYLAMHNIIEKPEKPFDGGLWFDSALLWEKIKDRLVRNSHNEVIFV